MPLRNVPKTLGPASACRHCAPVRQHQPSRIHGDPGTSTCRRALEALMDMDHGTHGIPCVHSRAGINLDLQSRVVWFGGSSPNGQDNSEWMTVTWICATMIQSHWRSVAQSEQGLGTADSPKDSCKVLGDQNQPKTTRPFTMKTIGMKVHNHRSPRSWDVSNQMGHFSYR